MEPTVKVIAGPLEYGSAPFWYHKTQTLYFVNVFQSEIHQYDPKTNKHTCAKVGDQPVGFIIPLGDFDDKYLLGYGCDLVAVTWDGHSNQISKLVKVEVVETNENRISDGKISPSGVLFVGRRTSGPGHLISGNLSMNQGSLYSFKNCSSKKLLCDISISAGMAWDHNERTFFYTDSPEYRVERFCYNDETCELEQGCILYQFKDDNLCGFPCGITIDYDEHLWVSCFNDGQVLKIDPKIGRATTKIEIPHCPQITSVAFGGPNLDVLYVTSADINIKGKYKNAGSVFQVSGLGVRGNLSLPLYLMNK
ncbi:regucalcin-like [Planococcus citri]|uniref:regucalcin-like n=1 Tax=Planococcus citri TaxID=170843 RepID=UPI0031F80496